MLSSQEAQKIAAGEVVERPASVVKEVIENSIDAGATQISLYIEKSGKNLIRVVDNGEGMSQDDAKLCFTTHATSKIEKLDDIRKILTFGFRGEGLASISSVSKVKLETKTNHDELGIKIEYELGEFLREEPIALSTGTDICIKDIFYNTPARKKFLKQDETEWNKIQHIFYAFCISNIDIHFKLYRDNKLILNIPVTQDVLQRTSQIWGHNFSQNLIELKKTNQLDLKLNFAGFISNHNFWRYGRQQIFFFVNKRLVKNKELSKGLLKGYLNVLPPARFPAAFIFINLNNSDIDINVHPRKEEVQFTKPKTIQLNLQKIVTQSLEANLSKQISIKSEINSSKSQENTYEISDESIVNSNSNGGKDSFKKELNFSELGSNFFPKTKPQAFSKLVNIPEQETINEYSNNSLEKQNNIVTQKQKIQIIGQLLKTYILFENDQGLVIIDQHAAHERILYEKFLNKFEKKEGTRLLFPEILNLNSEQIEKILKEKELFNNQGIEIDRLSNSEIVIKTSPPKIQNHSLKELVIEVLEFIQENEDHFSKEIFRKKLNEHMHTQMACKMAVKAGEILSMVMMQNIIDNLLKTNNCFICAHGRPTTWSLNKSQIERNFRRK
ncbi:DNA mismatch repair endonuclease MutL [Candidatus Dependentiae bacterium]